MRILKTLACILLVPGVAGAQDLPENTVAPTTTPRVQINTNLGPFVIELDPVRAPFTVDNFLSYVNQGHYTGTIFHRVIHGFVAQGGGFTTDYSTKPVGQSVVNESGNGLSNLRGTVGLARQNAPHSGTSQFYVNLADNMDLNPRPTRWGYTVFGRVVEGMDVIDEIGQKPTGSAGEFPRDVPLEMIVIESAEVLSE
ncbi:MAG: peptidyl-prolyl cis-trans isomerase [Gammaproteobacteria bacterium]|nr:peptidyl-prolyl cis-trans isomerase [Gammaproteobacteria bacterium]